MQKSITDVMQTLAMAGGSFEVAVTPAEAPSSVGIDHCEFLVAGHARRSSPGLYPRLRPAVNWLVSVLRSP